MEISKEYSNGNVTVVWKPKFCIHAAKCVEGLPHVFKPKEKPWIQQENATPEELINQVKQCPSGALSYYINQKEDTSMEDQSNEAKIQVMANGPLLVKGNLDITHSDGGNEKAHNPVAFCRCGHSQNKPFCDGNHKAAGFEG